jgi:hypothetical protein
MLACMVCILQPWGLGMNLVKANSVEGGFDLVALACYVECAVVI